jgi:hypothetical protein
VAPVTGLRSTTPQTHDAVQSDGATTPELGKAVVGAWQPPAIMHGSCYRWGDLQAQGWSSPASARHGLLGRRPAGFGGLEGLNEAKRKGVTSIAREEERRGGRGHRVDGGGLQRLKLAKEGVGSGTSEHEGAVEAVADPGNLTSPGN